MIDVDWEVKVWRRAFKMEKDRKLGGIRLKSHYIELTQIDEVDGSLVFLEGMSEIPFNIKRVFYIFHNPKDAVRANHANKNTDFVLIAVHGSVNVEVDDGRENRIFMLDSPNKGLYIPHMTWMRTFDFEEEAVLLVLASEKYEKSQYYEDYEVFIRVLNGD